VILPFTAGPALAHALDARSAPVRTTASVGLWALWGLVVLTLLLPRPVGLTLVRVVAPAAVVAAFAAAVANGLSPLALGSTVIAAALALSAETGWTFVNGAAYGDERRHLLRAPGPLLLGPLYLAWALLVAAAVAGPLLLAARQWALGVPALALGWPVAALLARALHSLTQRWAVFVPAGLVLKDHLALLDPVLFRRQEVERLHPAPTGTDALDLTLRAPGLALELRLHGGAPVTVVVPGRKAGEPRQPARLLFTPSRPGAVLADAEARRVPVR
jgi:hypothetical protein